MVGEQLGSFVIDGTLGAGAMGTVYRATHQPSGRPAAVKVMHQEVAQRTNALDRFKREQDILTQFRHPNIVRILAVGRHKGTRYFAMELVDGQTLEQSLQQKGRLAWLEVVDLARQMCDALQYAHDHGVIHRDLKPSNVLVTKDGRVKLTDFGIAKDLDATALTAEGRTLGTAAYMAPEQIRGTPDLSHKTDLYALGVMLYQLLTGQPPFEGNSPMVLMHAHLNTPVPRPSAKVEEIPKALDDLIVQLMAKSPTDRPWDAAAAGVVFNGLKEKAEKNAKIAMVWPSESKNPEPLPMPGVAPRGTTEAARKKKARRTAPAAEESPGDGRRRVLETAGLVLALVAMGGFLAWSLWPLSQDELYRRAEPLMKSDRRSDWSKAFEEYLDPLESKYPNHPYKDTVRGWRDKLMLAEADGRARQLASPVTTGFNKPDGANETRFVEFHALASAAAKANDEVGAAAVWDQMAAQLRPEEPADRPWWLLARARGDDLRRSVASRQAIVTRLLQEADAARQAGQGLKYLNLRGEVVQRYGQYTDVKAILGPTPDAGAPGAALPPATAPPAETPAPGAPAGTPADGPKTPEN